MFEEFSAGYYVGQFSIEPYDSDHAVLDRTQHVEANEEVYATGASIERVDHPIVIKVEQYHVPVFAADDVPMDTLGLPKNVLASTRIENPPTVKEVLVAKAQRAIQLLKWATPYTVRKPDLT